MRRNALYLGLVASLMLGSAAFAQAPDGAGNKPMPQTEQRSAPPPAATAPAPSQAQPAPAPSGRSGTTLNRDSNGTRGSVTIDRRDRGNVTIDRRDRGSVTVGRGDRFDRGDRVTRSERFDRRDRFDRGDNWRYRHRIRPAFAFISGPRVYVRPGWCRGLHRGWHFAPGAGEHAGTHRGLFRC